jgi:hypothetical protein
MEWIKITDKLPTEHLNVLTCSVTANKEGVDFVTNAIKEHGIKNPDIMEQWYYPVMQAFYAEGRWLVASAEYDGLAEIGVTHWMHMPKTPDNEN